MHCVKIMTCVLLITAGSPAQARVPALKLLEKLIKKNVRAEAGDVGRIFSQQADDAAKLLARKSPQHADEAKIFSRFRRLPGVDDSFNAEFRALPLAEQRFIVELGEGAQSVLRRYPQKGLNLLRHLDSDGLAQARTYGNFVVDGTAWLHSDEVFRALRATKLAPDQAVAITKTLGLKAAPHTLQPEHLAPLWKSVVRKTGNGAGRFWTTYVLPHKKKWLVGGLLVTYLAMPEKFHDGVGNLTQYAVKALSGLGVSAATGAARGLVNGPIDAVKKHYAADPVGTTISLSLIGVLILLAVPPFRRGLWDLLCRPLRLRRTPQHGDDKTPKGFSNHRPLQE